MTIVWAYCHVILVHTGSSMDAAGDDDQEAVGDDDHDPGEDDDEDSFIACPAHS